ncbi:MAG: hypothetical protein E6G81_07795 [Alphaproteobacteria bacterium]|nr:MAG: hypothetical protein E6G81_07795 [Alphaproteobacteria bacterium]
MRKGMAAAAIIAAVVVGAGMAAPAFAKHGNEHGGGPDGGWTRGSNPPGWSHGNKTGWGGHNMPPGLYKKFHSDRTYSNRYNGYSSRYWGYSDRYSRHSYPYSGYSNYRSYRNYYGY